MKQSFQRLTALLLALSMSLSLVSPAFASDSTADAASFADISCEDILEAEPDSAPEQQNADSVTADELTDAEETDETEPDAESSDISDESSSEILSVEETPVDDEEELTTQAWTGYISVLDYITEHGCNGEETAFPWSITEYSTENYSNHANPDYDKESSFRQWVADNGYDKLTLADWIERHNAQSWIQEVDERLNNIRPLARHLLLEGLLRGEYGMTYGAITSSMTQLELCQSVADLVGAIPDKQRVYDCCDHSCTVVFMIHALGIKGMERGDLTVQLYWKETLGISNNSHVNVVCYPEGDDKPYIMEADGANLLDNGGNRNGDFWSNGLWDYRLNPDQTAELIDYNGKATNLVIPSTVPFGDTEYTVTAIGCSVLGNVGEGSRNPDALDYVPLIESIVVPSTVTTIYDGSFRWHSDDTVSALKSVTGMSGVTAIQCGSGKYLFPSSVEVFNFYDESTTSPRANVIPYGITLLPSGRNDIEWKIDFNTMSTLKFTEGFTEFKAYKIYGSCEEVYLPESTRYIRSKAVTDDSSHRRFVSKLKSIYIPSGVEVIEDNAFFPSITLYAEASNTVAREYAEANGIKLITVTNVVTDTENCTRTWDVVHEHTPVEIPAVAATCTTSGHTAGKQCSDCGEVLDATKDVPALGHSWDGGVQTKVATCTTAGVITYTCTTCKETKTEDVPATGVHTPVTIPAVAATCTTAGHTAGKQCSDCGEVLDATKDIPALGHSWDGGVQTKAATCTTAGVITYTCTTCKETQTENIPATGVHTPVTIPAVVATCTTAGHTAGKQCSDCGEVLDATKDIPALGHSFTEIPAKVSTTTTDGNNLYYQCTECEKYFKADGLTETTPEAETIAKLVVTLKSNTITASNKTLTVKTTGTQTVNLGATVKDKAKLTYKSDNKSITVDSKGKVTVKKGYVGKATITITAAETKNYAKTTKKVTVTVNKAKQPMVVTPTAKNYKLADVKKKAQSLTLKVTKAQGAVTYKSSNTKYVTVSKGKVTVKKGAPKGKYTITVTAAGNSTYNKGSKTVTITVK